jgi:hypothetical protein
MPVGSQGKVRWLVDQLLSPRENGGDQRGGENIGLVLSFLRIGNGNGARLVKECILPAIAVDCSSEASEVLLTQIHESMEYVCST